MTRRAVITTQPHQQHGWRWRVVLLCGSGAAERPADVVAAGCAPTEALAQRRAFGAWESFTSDYPGHYELVNTEPGGAP